MTDRMKYEKKRKKNIEKNSVTECLTSDIFSMLLCGVSDCIYCI